MGFPFLVASHVKSKAIAMHFKIHLFFYYKSNDSFSAVLTQAFEAHSRMFRALLLTLYLLSGPFALKID